MSTEHAVSRLALSITSHNGSNYPVGIPLSPPAFLFAFLFLKLSIGGFFPLGFSFNPPARVLHPTPPPPTASSSTARAARQEPDLAKALARLSFTAAVSAVLSFVAGLGAARRVETSRSSHREGGDERGRRRAGSGPRFFSSFHFVFGKW